MSQALGFVFGGIACMCAAMVTHPIDTIKVRLQLQLSSLQESKYKGFYKGIHTVVQEEGIRGLYKGISASLLREATYSTVRMGLYEPFKRALKSDGEVQDTLFKKIIAGGLSGAVGSAFANPTDLIKVRMQANASRNESVWRIFTKIIETQGWKGLYRGVGPTTQRAVILTASQLPSYDHTKRVLLQSGYFKEGILIHCVSSMVAGLVCATTTAPIDLVKSRFMQDQIRYNSTLDCFSKTIRSEGFLGLFKGWIPQWLRIGPHTIVTFLVLEQLRRLSGLAPV